MAKYPEERHFDYSFPLYKEDMARVIEHANALFNMRPEMIGGEVDGSITFIIDHNTTQGIEIRMIAEGMCQVRIPALSTEPDIAYAFTLLRAVRELYPDNEIKFRGRKADISPKAQDRTFVRCRENMRDALAERNVIHKVFGCRTNYIFSARQLEEQFPDCSLDDLVDIAFGRFTTLEFMAGLLPWAKTSSVDFLYSYGEDDEEWVSPEVVKNRTQFVQSESGILCLDYNNRYKLVSVEEFLREASNNPNFDVFSYSQFAMRQMSDQEWSDFWNRTNGKEVRKPRTFILRWNPNVSQTSIDDYNEMYNNLPDETAGVDITWSISDWQSAREGDLFYMLLEGENVEHTGIVYAGRFASAPYVADDWRGTGEAKHYVLAESFNLCDLREGPWITTAELEKAVPSFNWRNGSSGEEITSEQAEILESLWLDCVGEPAFY